MDEVNSVPSPRSGLSSAQSSQYHFISPERSQIVGGFVIPYEQGRTWLQRAYNISLKPDHSQDLTATVRLEEAINERGYNWEMEFAQSGNRNYDLLLVTQRIHGHFMNLGPEGEEEVLQDNLKDILKPGEEEDVARRVLLKDFRGWSPCRSCILGLITQFPEIDVATEFKCFFYPL